MKGCSVFEGSCRLGGKNLVVLLLLPKQASLVKKYMGHKRVVWP